MTNTTITKLNCYGFFAIALLYLLLIQLVHAWINEKIIQINAPNDFIILINAGFLLLMFGPLAIIMIKNFIALSVLKKCICLSKNKIALVLIVAYFITIILFYKNCSVGYYCIEFFWKQFNFAPSQNTRVFLDFYYYIFDSISTLIYLIIVPLIMIWMQCNTVKKIAKSC